MQVPYRRRTGLGVSGRAVRVLDPHRQSVKQAERGKGDGVDEENVGSVDFFLALTNDDENNIMSCLLAKRLGARRVLALINRRAYAELMEGGQIDIALTPSHATLGALLKYIRRGDVAALLTAECPASECRRW